MALTATATQGFEFLRYTCYDEVLYIPGDPGDTFTEGDQVVVTVGEGVLDPGAANEGGLIGRVAKTISCPANTQEFPLPRSFDPASLQTIDDCLIPIKVNVPVGLPIYKCTFKNHWDDTVAAYVAATRMAAMTTGMTADDYPNGGLVYVYEGPGIGEVNVVSDYDHTGGNNEKDLEHHRKFATDLTTSSKVIVLGGEGAANRGVGFFGRCESADEDELTVNQGANDGDWAVFMDYRESARYLKNLTLPVIPARYLLAA